MSTCASRISLACFLVSLSLLAACASAPVVRVVPAVTGEGRIEVFVDGDLFTRLETGGALPYLYPLKARGGVSVTRGFPMDPREGEEHDHPHHQSLWLAHGDVGGHDFWHGEDTRLATRSVDVVDAVVTTEHAWLAGERLVLDGRRRLSFGAWKDARWIDFEIVLIPAEAGVTFGDTKEGTFALRLAPRLRVDGPAAEGELFDSEGRSAGDVWGKRARWIAATGPAGAVGENGAPVTVALFDHPGNPRHPTWWHARRYGLLAANPFGRHDFEGAPEGAGDLEVRAGLVLRYRVWVASGVRGSDELEDVWRDFVETAGTR